MKIYIELLSDKKKTEMILGIVIEIHTTKHTRTFTSDSLKTHVHKQREGNQNKT